MRDNLLARASVGNWYPLLPLTDRNFIICCSPSGFFPTACALPAPVALAAIALTRRSRHVIDREHLRGLRLLAPKQHNRQLRWLGHAMGSSSGRHCLGASVIAANEEC